MKKIASFLLFLLISTFVIAQEAASGEEASGGKNYTKKYFISTNSGIKTTPVGFRVGFLDRRGAYLAARFGKGNNYELDQIKRVKSTPGTMFSATVGLIFPIFCRENNFKAHAFTGIGYGHWFNRPNANEIKMGAELESGFILSYSKIMMTIGGCILAGDGNTPKTDITVGIGYRIY